MSEDFNEIEDLSWIEELVADSEKFGALTDEKIKSVSHAMKLQMKLEDMKVALKKASTTVQAALDLVQDRRLAELLIETGASGFTLEDGSKVALTDIYMPAVLVDDRSKVNEWLNENNHGGIIDASVVINLGKGGYEEAKALASRVQELTNSEVKVAGDIHWATFRAFAKKEVEAFEKLPLEARQGKTSPFPDELKVHKVSRAKIKRAE